VGKMDNKNWYIILAIIILIIAILAIQIISPQFPKFNTEQPDYNSTEAEDFNTIATTSVSIAE